VSILHAFSLVPRLFTLPFSLAYSYSSPLSTDQPSRIFMLAAPGAPMPSPCSLPPPPPAPLYTTPDSHLPAHSARSLCLVFRSLVRLSLSGFLFGFLFASVASVSRSAAAAVRPPFARVRFPSMNAVIKFQKRQLCVIWNETAKISQAAAHRDRERGASQRHTCSANLTLLHHSDPTRACVPFRCSGGGRGRRLRMTLAGVGRAARASIACACATSAGEGATAKSASSAPGAEGMSRARRRGGLPIAPASGSPSSAPAVLGRSNGLCTASSTCAPASPSSPSSSLSSRRRSTGRAYASMSKPAGVDRWR